MSSMELSLFAEVGLVIFVLVFCSVLVWLAWEDFERELEDARRLPLDEQGDFTPRERQEPRE